MFSDYKNLRILISQKKDGNMRLIGCSVNNNLRNRKEFFQKNNIKEKEVVTAKLVGEDNVKLVSADDKGKIFEKVDGLITAEKDIFLTITVADCLPVFLFDRQEGVIALLHCGWRGLYKNIIKKTLNIFKNNFGSNFEEILVAIGPGICNDCYEIKEDLEEKFKNYPRVIERKSKKIFLDLKKVAQMKLIESGIKKGNIETSIECTSCLENKYFSHRRDNLKEPKVEMVIFGIV